MRTLGSVPLRIFASPPWYHSQLLGVLFSGSQETHKIFCTIVPSIDFPNFFLFQIKSDVDTSNFLTFPAIDSFATGSDESGWDFEF